MISFRFIRILCTALLTLSGFLVPTFAQAHALQPGYLEMRDLGQDTYSVLWKVPAVREAPMDISVLLPENCEIREPGDLQWDGIAYISRWTTICTGGLADTRLSVVGLERTSTDVLARIENGAGDVETLRLTPSETEVELVGQRSLLQIAGTYFRLGVEHILGGLDHLAFVAALLLLATGWRRLLGTITAFTVAHSITLAASTLGVITVPVAPIETLIALSIVFVAVEIVQLHRGRTSLTIERPWLIAFAFGLLHGVGFASALTEIGLPQNAIPLSLLFFNLGVEVGQLIFVAAALGILAIAGPLLRRLNDRARSIADLIPPYVIGSLAVFWVLQRMSAF